MLPDNMVIGSVAHPPVNFTSLVFSDVLVVLSRDGGRGIEDYPSPHT